MNDDTKLQQLFHVLRLCGAAMIIAAAGTFLVQSWGEAGDVLRYLALLGMTALLPVVAYICGVRFAEGKSARVLVLTFLTLVPIHAGVLGGFVLSQLGAAEPSLGPVAQWVAPSPLAALLLVLGASTVLMPLSWAAFRVLARPHATLLTGASVATHALLLVPERSPLAATLTILPVLGVVGWCTTRVKPETREAKLAVAFLGAPALVIAARQLLFYDASLAFWAGVLGACAVGMLAIGRGTGDAVLERLALLPTALSTGALAIDLGARLSMSPEMTILSYGWLTGAVALTIALRSRSPSRFFVLSAIAINGGTGAVVLMEESSAVAALQLIAVGIALASYGFISNRKFPLLTGIGFAGTGFIAEVSYAIDAFEPGGWLALGACGGALVALTAWLERRARGVRGDEEPAKVSRAGAASLPG